MHDSHAHGAHRPVGWIARLSLLVASSLAAGSAHAGSTAFVVEALDTMVNGGADNGKTDLVVDSTGQPRVTYLGSPRNVRVAIRTEASWLISIVEAETASYWPSIAVDDDDILHFTYQVNTAGGPGDERMVYRRTPSGSPQTIAGSEGDPGGEGNDLVEDGGMLHAAFRNDATFDYALNGGQGTWSIETILTNAFDVSLDDGASIAVAPNGTPFVTWTPSSCALGAQIARRVGTDNWLVEAIPGSGCVDGHVGLDIDADGCAHVAFRNADLDAVMYAERPAGGSPSDWTMTTVHSQAGAGRQLDLELDADGGVHVVYTDGAQNVWYAVRRFGSSAFVRHLVSSGQAAERPSVGVDGDARAWVAFTGASEDSPGNDDIFIARIPVQTVDAQEVGSSFEWRIATDDDVTDVTGFFRRGGESDYRPLPSLVENTGVWSAAIDPADYGPRGLEVYLNVTTMTDDGPVQTVFGTSDEPVQVRVGVAALSRPSLVPGTYRLVSAPMLIDGRDNTNAILQSAYGPSGPNTWRMARWVEALSGYRNVDVSNIAGFAHGAAYWLGVAIQRPLVFSGTAVLPAATDPFFRVPLEPGWTMAGNPAAYTVSMDAGDLLVEQSDGTRTSFAQATVDGNVSGTFFGYAGGQYVSNPPTLDMWDGVWILNTTAPAVDLTLLVPAIDVAAAREPATREPAAAARVNAWTLALHAQTTTGVATAEIGIDEKASAGEDLLDAPAPPQPPGADVRLTLLPDTGGRPLYRDVRPPGAGQYRLVLESDREPVTLTLESPAGVAPHDVVVRDEVGEWTRTLRAPASLSLPSGRHRLDISVSTDAPAPLPERLALRAAPNPARGAATVTYVLPAAANVHLDLFDVAGRRVAQRAFGRVPGGTHLVDLRAVEGGNALSSGVYVARLEARFEDGTRASPSTRLVVTR